MEMDNNNQQDRTLLEDKALANELFSKEALTQYDANTELMPADYFDYQTSTILKKIKRKKALQFKIGLFSKIAIAASLITIMVASYKYYQKKDIIDPNPVMVKIEEISTDELEAYVNSNELIIEADLQTAINEEAIIISTINDDSASNLDSNSVND
jgi:hypothetical protein